MTEKRIHSPKPGPVPEAQETPPRAAPTIAPEDEDAHQTPIQRVPGPGPADRGKGAAGEEAVDRLTRR